MQRRIFIMGVNGFPRNSAAANYVQYLAKSLTYSPKWDVYVIGIGINRKEDYIRQSGKYIYNNIEYYNCKASDNRITKICKTDNNYFMESDNIYHFNKDDYIISYGKNLFLLKWATKILPVNQISICLVELYRSYQFKLGLFNPKMIIGKIADSFIRRKGFKILPISRYIAERYKNSNCPFMVLPIMSDPYEFEYRNNKQRGTIIQMVYPGAKNTDYEDDLPCLLSALSCLKDEELNRIEIHFTGATVERFYAKYKEMNKRIERRMIFHGWMDYEQLITLYEQSEYLLLVRKINKITMANFPSKIPELMTYGVVPICTKVGDYTDLYLSDGKNCIQILGTKSDDVVVALRKAIHMETDIYNKLSQEARASSIDMFAYDKWSEKITNFLA